MQRVTLEGGPLAGRTIEINDQAKAERVLGGLGYIRSAHGFRFAGGMVPTRTVASVAPERSLTPGEREQLDGNVRCARARMSQMLKRTRNEIDVELAQARAIQHFNRRAW